MGAVFARLAHIDAQPGELKHFKLSPRAHPLKITKADYEAQEKQLSSHFGRQQVRLPSARAGGVGRECRRTDKARALGWQNHIWSEEEIKEKLATVQDHHVPVTVSDRIAHTIMMYGLYHPFNFITGYSAKDPSPQSIEWRLIILESFAGVPGFVAAGFRHFRSLRLLKKDYGWIHTLLEEVLGDRRPPSPASVL